MIRRPLTRAGGAAVAACLCLLWGRSTLAGAPANAAPPAAAEAPPAVIGAGETQSIGVQFGTAAVASVRPATSLVPDAAATTPPVTATGEGIAAIPLPPSAYPGMVGLATAAFSVWRYRRRRRR